MNSGATGTCPHREDDAQQQDVPKYSASTGSRSAHHSKAGWVAAGRERAGTAGVRVPRVCVETFLRHLSKTPF